MLQFTLPSIPAPIQERPKHRLFFAVLVPRPIGQQIAQMARVICKEHALNILGFNCNRLHVSLQGLGDYAEFPRNIAAWARSRARSLKHDPFTVTFDRISHLTGRSPAPRRSPVTLTDSTGAEGLKEMHRTLAASLEVKHRSSFTPHVTLFYEQRKIAEQAIDPVSWTVTDFVLIHSRINSGGLRPYSVIARWPLG